MSDSVFETVEKSCQVLKLDFTSTELAVLAQEQDMTADQLQAIGAVFDHIRQKKVDTTIHTLLKMSRLPLKDPKTFETFDFSIIKGRDVKKLQSLSSLSAIYAHKNLAFIGPAGTGKTHLAQAFGYECCQRGIKTYFIKMSELRDKFTVARRTGKEASVINGLVRPSCLIIDEVSHCEFDKENTRLFFDLIDRRYNKEGKHLRFLYNRGDGGVLYGRLEKRCKKRTGHYRFGCVGTKESLTTKDRKSNGLRVAV